MARFVSGLLKTAMQTVYDNEQELLAEYIRQLDSGNLIPYIRSVSGDKLKSIKTRLVS
jgi:hypothetical protein